MSEDVVRFMDFSSAPEPVQFRIDDDVFEAYRVLSIPSLQEAVKVMKLIGDLKMDDPDADETIAKMEKFIAIFDALLIEESAARFKARAMGKENPIGLKQIISIISWLLEVYGFRPTQQSSDSSGQSANDDSGTGSTDGASLVGSESSS